MRLYLSSYRLGHRYDLLLDALQGKRRVAIIANAQDAKDHTERKSKVAEDTAMLGTIGCSVTEIDLREYFNDIDTTRLAGVLAGVDGLWVRGGNCFLLREALAKSHADSLITALLFADHLVYAAESAGVCVLSKDMAPLKLADQYELAAALYKSPTTNGLGIINATLIPHYDENPAPEALDVRPVVQRCIADAVPYQLIRDGEVLVVEGANSHVYSASSMQRQDLFYESPLAPKRHWFHFRKSGQ